MNGANDRMNVRRGKRRCRVNVELNPRSAVFVFLVYRQATINAWDASSVPYTAPRYEKYLHI